MSEKIQIILSNTEDKKVSLSAMTADEFTSFMLVANALKQMVSSLVNQDDLKISMFEGSAGIAVAMPDDNKAVIGEEIDLAIEGASDNEDVTEPLRVIQKEFKKKKSGFKFSHEKGGQAPIFLHDRIIQANQIRKRRNKKQATHQLEYIKGRLQANGGKSPNYHLDFTGSEKVTIDCTESEAKSINQFLYENIAVIALVEITKNSTKKPSYAHKVVVEENIANRIATALSGFFETYFSIEDDLVQQLTLMYDFIDEEFEKNKEDAFEILRILLLAFNDKKFHQSELKTLLVISKPFKEHKKIDSARASLLETWKKQKGI